jgi:hypothetical protein
MSSSPSKNSWPRIIVDAAGADVAGSTWDARNVAFCASLSLVCDVARGCGADAAAHDGDEREYGVFAGTWTTAPKAPNQLVKSSPSCGFDGDGFLMFPAGEEGGVLPRDTGSSTPDACTVSACCALGDGDHAYIASLAPW